nr:MAG TPA: hypothetical protein [Caudoviricetes sp.]
MRVRLCYNKAVRLMVDGSKRKGVSIHDQT